MSHNNKNIQTLEKAKGQIKKYRNLVGSDQQMERLEETEIREADRTIRVNHIINQLFVSFI